MERAFDLEELLSESGWLRQLAASLVGDGGRADDLVQDTWLAALRRPPRTAEEPRPWLARVVGNLARNERRGRARRAEREVLVHEERVEPGPDALAQAAEAQRMLADAVTRLDEPLRAVIVLRYFQGLDSAAAAARLGVPASTLRTRLQRALEELRADLDRRCKGERSAWALLLAPLARETRVGTAAGASAAPALTLGAWLAAAGLLGVLALGARQWNAARAEGEREETLAAASVAESEPVESALASSGDAREPVAAPVVAAIAPGVSGQPPADFQSEISGTVLVDGRAPEWPITLTLEPELPPAEPNGLRRRMPRPVLTLAPEQRGAFTFRRLPPAWRGRLLVDDFLFVGGESSMPVEWPVSGLVVELRSAPDIVGRVLAPDGLPIAGLEGTFEFRIGPTGMPATDISTQGFACREDGRFRIRSRIYGESASLTLAFEADGHGYLRHDTPSFVPSEGLDVGDLTLERTGSIEFVVRDANGTPLAGAFARIEGLPYARRSNPTDGDGRGVLGWMPERGAAVRFSALAFEDRVLTVDPRSSPEVVLEPLAMLTVRLRGSADRVLLTSESPAFLWDTSDRPHEAQLQTELGGPQSYTRRSSPGQRWEYEYSYEGPLRLIGLTPGVALTLEAKDSAGRTLAADTLSLERGARAELELGEPGARDDTPASETRPQTRRKEPR